MPSPRLTPRTVPGPTHRVVVIGAGLGGLAATLRLVGAGRQVTVLERAAAPGGLAGRLELAGYRFDTGPTVLTMPELIGQALSWVGERLADRLELMPLSPAYRADFADGSTLDVHADPDRMEQQIAETISARDAAGYRELVGFLRRLYRLELAHFIDRNLDSSAQLLGSAGLRLLAMGGLRRLAPKIGSYLADERLRRIFSFQAMYAGLAPQDALAIYAVIAYLDTVAGVSFPRGGMHAVPQALAAAAAEHGAEFRYRTEAIRIEVAGGRARAVHTGDGERIPADVVVVNGDPATAYRQLLHPDRQPRRRLRYSPSCVLLHVGSRQGYPQLAHHTIFFGKAWRSTFDEVIRDGRLMSDPSFLVSYPSGTDPALAPAGRHGYYVLFPAPNTLAPLDWPRIAEPYRQEMHAQLEARGLAGFADQVEVEAMVTPADWQAHGLPAGTPFATAHTAGQTGPFRFPTLDRGIENLLFCGSSCQPGVGVPMVLLSGKLAAERILGAAPRVSSQGHGP